MADAMSGRESGPGIWTCGWSRGKGYDGERVYYLPYSCVEVYTPVRECAPRRTVYAINTVRYTVL
jgi:hypothetical protein